MYRWSFANRVVKSKLFPSGQQTWFWLSTAQETELRRQERGNRRFSGTKKWTIFLGATSSLFAAGTWLTVKRRKDYYGAKNRIEEKKGTIEENLKESEKIAAHSKDFLLGPPQRPDLPIFTMKDVSAHKSLQDKTVWVTYKSGVYDVTKFIQEHPGGDVLLLAGGGSLEPFWDLYGQHKTSDVSEILESLRIGNLDPKEVEDIDIREKRRTDKIDLFSGEPVRHPGLIVNSEKPFNAEVPSQLLVKDFLTPNELFFVRNHLPVPNIDIKTYQLNVMDQGTRKTSSFSLEDLKSNFSKVTVTATIQCAGNRRSGMNSDVLEKVVGIEDLKKSGVKHIQFEGLDRDELTNQCFGTSVPLEKALNPDTILAYEMNGQPLPIDHGFPLRVIIPGVVGARQAKWLSRIIASSEESQSMWQQRDYKSFSPSATPDKVDYGSAPAIQDAPIVSAICEPKNGQEIESDRRSVEVKGYAWSGGGQGIIRVDVSADGGKNWTTARGSSLNYVTLLVKMVARLFQPADQGLWNMWAWTLWSAWVNLPANLKSGDRIELVCKATNVSYNSQPEFAQSIWNFRGLLNNSWHRISVGIA